MNSEIFGKKALIRNRGQRHTTAETDETKDRNDFAPIGFISKAAGKTLKRSTRRGLCLGSK